MRRYFFILAFLFACFHGYGQEFGARIKLKQKEDKSYLATEDLEIRALISKHGVAFRQDCPGAKNPELLLLYSITNEYYREINMANVIKDFLATGKFEDDIIFYEEVHPATCPEPASVNDPSFNNTHGWALKMIEAPCAWLITAGNPNVLIGLKLNKLQ